MKVTALLTGRGNNTLKNKNILDVAGHPVLYYPANAGRKAKTIDNFYVSSDDEMILNTAAEYGYSKIVRPAELASPTAQHVDCIIHALNIMKDEGKLPDIVVVLLANNVTVKSEWIDDCVEIMKKDDSVTAVVPVYKDNDHHPFRAKKIDPEGNIQMFEENAGSSLSTNRQDLPPCYFLSHNFWVLRVESLLRDPYAGQAPWSFMGNVIKPYIIDESIDIHALPDLLIAEEWLKNNYCD